MRRFPVYFLCFAWFFQCSVAPPLFAADTTDNAFDIEAWAFDRGNFAIYIVAFRDGGPPVVASSGVSPAVIEYDIPFPIAGKYSLSVFAASQQLRPLTLFLNDEKIGVVCHDKTTATFNSIDAEWFTPVEFIIPESGIHTIMFSTAADAHPPHLVLLRFTSEQPLPPGYTVERPEAHELPPEPREQPQGETNLTAAAPKPDAIRRAIVDLIETYGERYPKGAEYLIQLDALIAQEAATEEFESLRYEAVFLANPVIDFDEIFLVRRNNRGPGLGLPTNWESYSSLPKSSYDDEIMTLNIKSQQAELRSFYKPPRDTLVADVCLDFDANRLMFSAVGNNDRWHLFEMDTQSKEARQITSGDKDVDFYDSCYLPDGRIITTCTAPMVGVPCVAGGSHVANLFLVDPMTQEYRQLAFDQEHNWSPRVLNDGRVLYTRWEYADIPHSNSRLLFSCNPDGTLQLAYHGSNSYWPNSYFYTRPIPNHPTQVIGVISGHHDQGRAGELVLFDPAISRHEAEGALQKIPGYGKKVEAVVVDGLTRKAWPKFTHPAPLSEKYFLVAARPRPEASFGIYLVDVFDNMILLKELSGNSLFEPIPMRATERPPIIPDRVDLTRDDADIFIADIYHGQGLPGIPRETVKALKIYTYHYAYHGTGGLLGSVGQDGPWDVRAVLGTVPVEADGSVNFRAPAKLPIAVLPLDEQGQAIQLMRSWMTAMPGEHLHCAGCHESQNSVPPSLASSLPQALRKKPAEIIPYNQPNPEGKTLLEQLNVRGFSFHEQVQPVLDAYCVSCHNGEADQTANTKTVNDSSVGTAIDGKPFAINLRGDQMIDGWYSVIAGNCGPNWGGKWTVGYDNLQRFVRRAGIESDYGLLVPMEFAANTTELVQLLKQGHYGVELDPESWNRLITWVDMNTPYHGNWRTANQGSQLDHIAQRRVELAELYGAVGVEFEKEQPPPIALPIKETRTLSQLEAKPTIPPKFDAMTADEAKRLQQNLSSETEKTIVLALDNGEELSIRLVRIPAYGELEKPFWMGTFEITNAQYRQFDPAHTSGIESRHGYQFGRRGYDVNGDELPVVRVSWNRANDFCQWLSKQTGLEIALPSEQQWEYACRAGTATPFWFGDLDTDFSPYANFGDFQLKEFVADTAYAEYTDVWIVPDPNPFDDRVPKDERFDDGNFLQAPPGSYLPNPFGLYDMHGNVAEWTRSELHLPGIASSEMIVKGGSWYDRPYRSTSDFRVSYPAYQPVFNVGFRIVVEE